MNMKNIVDDLLDGEGFRRYDLRLYQKTKYCASRPSVSEHKLVKKVGTKVHCVYCLMNADIKYKEHWPA